MHITILPFEFWKKFTKYTIIGSSLLMLLYVGVYSITSTSAQTGPDPAEAKHQDNYRSRSDIRAVAIANSYSYSGGNYPRIDRYRQNTYQPYSYPVQSPNQYPQRVVYNDPVTYNYDYDINYRDPRYSQPTSMRSDCRHHCYYDGTYDRYPTTSTTNYWSGWNPDQYARGVDYNTTNYWSGWDPNRYSSNQPYATQVNYWADWDPSRYERY